MNYSKKFIPCIFLYQGKAYLDFNKSNALYDDPVVLASRFSDAGADEIIVFDLSTAGNDKEHDEALDIIKKICKVVDTDVIGAGNVKRMEDIKKLLYAGCKKACLNFSKEGNVEIIREVSEKFGKDKICVCYSNNGQIYDNKELVNEYASELINIEDQDLTNVTFTDLPIIVMKKSASLEEMISLFENDKVSGLTGIGMNDNCANIDKWKAECNSKNIPICKLDAKFSWDDLKKNSDGMVPVIVQDYRTDQVLMLAYMNEEAYNTTLQTGKMTYYSRSRQSLWIKGETSSHFQYVKALYADCDYDTILAKVKQVGAACHTGSYSCFFNEIAHKDYSEKNPQKVLDNVFDVIKDRKVNPREGSYTNYLFDKGIDKILKKVGEEATEIVIAAKNPNENEIVYELSDFLYHMMVLMAEKNVNWEDVTDELSRR